MNTSYSPSSIRLMVVDPRDGRTLLGILARIDVLMALERLDERQHQI
ncbi:MAG TPA: hypothetical protein HA366_02990 [Candidatus Methanomethylophilaceae archaeon]|nr:hypothetical protein [Candidatus Methanomethylophilaceae archaeon]